MALFGVKNVLALKDYGLLTTDYALLANSLMLPSRWAFGDEGLYAFLRVFE
jgi:hypothetical protein